MQNCAAVHLEIVIYLPPPLIQQECFPDAVHFRARLWGQWGQRVEQQPDTWQELGAEDGKVVPKGLLQAEGPTAGPAPSPEPRTLRATASQEAGEAGPARWHQVCLLHKAKVRLRYRQQGLPRLAQPQPHHWRRSHPRQTLQCHHRG